MTPPRLLLRSTHAIHGGGSGCYAPFLQLWERRSLNLPAGHIGIISAVTNAASVCGVPALCAGFDRLGSPQRGFAVLVLVDAMLHIGYTGLSHLLAHVPLPRLVLVLPCIVLGELVHQSTYSVLDAITMSCLQDKLEYGRIRLPAGIAWAIMSLAVGSAMQVWTVNIDVIFIGFAVSFCSMSVMWVFVRLPPPPNPHDAAELSSVNDVESPLLHTPGRMGCNWQFAELAFIIFCMGIGNACADSFVFLLIDDLGGSTLTMALSLPLNVLTEVPVFWYSKQFIVVLGPRGVMYLGVAAYFLRLAWYAIAWSPWSVLIAEPLHGLTFALIWSNLATIAAEIAPAGHEALAQGTLNAIFNGLGGVTGCLVGGILYQQLQQVMFGVMASVMFFVGISMVVVDSIRHARRSAVQSQVRPQQELTEGHLQDR